jgi:hypothetical protein
MIDKYKMYKNDHKMNIACWTEYYGGKKVTCVCFYLSRAHEILCRGHEFLSRGHEIDKSWSRDTMSWQRDTMSWPRVTKLHLASR